MSLIVLTTLVAELVAAAACHVVAALTALNPELALGALFHLGAAYEIQELIIFRQMSIVDTVLRAVHTIVPVSAAIETIRLGANLAFEFGRITLVELEYVFAVGCWAPGHVHVSVYEELELALLVLGYL